MREVSRKMYIAFVRLLFEGCFLMTDAVEYPDLVVGAGLFGLTVAQQAVEHLGVGVEIIDVRDHIGGNAYSYMDEETGAERSTSTARTCSTRPTRGSGTM